MHLSGIGGRIALALLWGVVTFVALLILGAIVAHVDAGVGSILEHWSALIGLLVGLVVFFFGTRGPGRPIGPVV